MKKSLEICLEPRQVGQITSKSIVAIEKLFFFNFTLKIPEVKEENYWAILSSLKMYSQERRMERYRILYMWKIIEGFAPNCGVEIANENERLGRKIKIPILKKNGRMAVLTLREQSFQVNGAKLFYSIPKKIRNIKFHQDEFKEALDNYLSLVPDQPKMGALVPEATDQLSGRQSNSLLAWTHNHNA